MINNMEHLRLRLHEIDMLIMLIHDSLAMADTTPEVLDMIKVDLGILVELVMRLNDELNPQ